MAEGNMVISKYIKPSREKKVFRWVAIAFLFSLFVMPQYFGLPLPVFDFTLLRIMIVLVTLFIIADTERKKSFVGMILNSGFTKALIPYLIVIGYTMVLRVDINAFLNPFIELYSLYLLVYLVRDVLGVEATVKYLRIFCYILAFLGLVEFVLGVSPFSYLETVKGIYTGRFIRSGHYRIMSSANHSLGYGLMLILMTPFACYDQKLKEVNVFAHFPLLLMLALNVFLTGSRSTLGVFVIEIILMFFVSSRKNQKKFLMICVLLIAALAVFLVVFQNTALGSYMMLQITTILDEILGTEMSVKYGANPSALSSSSNYRAQLKYIFQVDWLNPLLGIGRKRTFAAEINGSFVRSVDNFYIAEYIRYAYPGLISYIIFVGYFVIEMIKKIRKGQSALIKVILMGIICYLINLKWVDSLQTLKYLYVAFAIYAALAEEEGNSAKQITVFESKYIKKRGVGR
ncbi:MAG: O-antigen ligase family protein [Lachnospiraceae bacterium]|nr:O-antigen ligase family protein [Lachnospiraceae bacterium]